MVLMVYHITLHDYVVKGSCEFMDGKAHMEVTTLPSLVTIDIVVWKVTIPPNLVAIDTTVVEI